MSIRVLVADDHPVFREGLVAILDSADDIEVIGVASDGTEAVAQVEALSPDAVLMDVKMPNTTGIEATVQIRVDKPDLPVLMLTMNDDDESLVAAMRAGANGYLLKEATSEDIRRGIRAVVRGEAVFGPSVAPRVIAALSGNATGARDDYPFPQLTDREREILHLLAGGLDNGTIARRLYVSDKTVRNNVSNIMNKLSVASRAAAVATARDVGIG